VTRAPKDVVPQLPQPRSVEDDDEVPALLKQRVGLRLWGFPMPTQSEGFRVYDPKLLQDRTQLSNVQALNWMAATLYSPFISNGTLP